MKAGLLMDVTVLGGWFNLCLNHRRVASCRLFKALLATDPLVAGHLWVSVAGRAQMKMARSKRSKGKATPDKDEATLTEAVAYLRSLSPDERNYTRTARQFSVNMYNLRNRFLGKHQSPRKAHENQQLLSAAQSQIRNQHTSSNRTCCFHRVWSWHAYCLIYRCP